MYDIAPCLRHTSRIAPGLPRLFWLGVVLYIMEAIVYPKRPNTRRNTSYPRAPAEYSDWCRKYLFYDTAVRSWHTPRTIPREPRLRWHVVRLSLTLWCTSNGSVLNEIRRTRVHPQNSQTRVVNKPKLYLIYDTGVANTLFTTPRHVHNTHAGSSRRCHGCFGMV